MRKTNLSFGLIALILIILILHINYFRFICDDAFISFRYAKNFVEGHGLVYNIGERVEGYTNFLWTLLLSLFMRLGLDVVIVSQVLGALFSAATVLLLLHLNQRLYPKDNVFNFLAPLFLACCGAYAAWATGGLETSFYTFSVFLGAYLFITGTDHSSYFVLSGVTFAFVSMTRLDGLVFAGVTFLGMVYFVFAQKRIGFRSLLKWMLCFLIPFLLYFFWRWSYYGKLLPNTFYVKVGGSSLYHQGFLYLFDFVKRFWMWFFIIPLVFLGKATRSNAKLKIIVLYFTSLTIVFSLYVVYVGGDFMDMFRFLVPVLPFFFFLVQEGFRGIYYYIEHTHSGSKSQFLTRETRKIVLVTAEILLVIVSIFLLARPSKASNEKWSRRNVDSIATLREYTRVWSKVGLMFKHIAKPGESLSTTAAGVIPFYSELYTIDEFGLTLVSEPRSALIGRGVSRPGHDNLVTDEFIASRKPTYVLGHPKTYDESNRPQWQWVVNEPFASAGYKVEIFLIRISDNQAKYFYFLSLREFD